MAEDISNAKSALTTSGFEADGENLKIAKLARSLKRYPIDGRGRNNLFLIGAGVSVTANIPDARTIAKLLVLREFHDQNGDARNLDVLLQQIRGENSDADVEGAYSALVSRRHLPPRYQPTSEVLVDAEVPDWHSIYDDCFKEICNDPQNTRSLFSGLVDAADGAINWSHLVLGEMVKQRYVQTVMTTNFDQLVLKGMVMAGILPVVCDGIESLNRIQGLPTHPQLLEIHGSRFSYTLRNDPADVEKLKNDPSVIGAYVPCYKKRIILSSWDMVRASRDLWTYL